MQPILYDVGAARAAYLEIEGETAVDATTEFEPKERDRSSFWIGLCVLTAAYCAAVFAVRIIWF